MYKRVYSCLDNTHQLYDSQYGFRQKHSCEHAIAEFTGNILKGKENGAHTVSVYLDLSKAFDTLEYNTLFSKMECYGIRGNALNWFKSYLSGREMRTKCTINHETHFSSKRPVTFEAPQGSCLGPLIFLIFCNDLHLNLEFMQCILFADDTTLYYSNTNISLLMVSIEHDMSILSDWFKANKLTLNKSKSVAILFKANKKISCPSHLLVDNSKINFVSHTKFLGVWIDEQLLWDVHVNKLLLKVQRNAHMLYKSKRLLNVLAKKILYYAQIYSHISYGISVWGPMTKTSLLNKLLSIQKKCWKSVHATDPKEFLLVFDIIKLEIAKFGWKLKNKCLPVALQNCTISSHTGGSLVKVHKCQTRNKLIPNVPNVRNNQYKSSIFCKSISLLGKMPAAICNQLTFKSFTNKFKSYLRN